MRVRTVCPQPCAFNWRLGNWQLGQLPAAAESIATILAHCMQKNARPNLPSPVKQVAARHAHVGEAYRAIVHTVEADLGGLMKGAVY